MTEPTFEILHANDPRQRGAWLQAWGEWPAREVFAHPSYVELFADEHQVAAVALGRISGMTILYPFIIRSLRPEPFWDETCGECVDLVSPYGYGGPYWWGEGNRRKASRAFWGLFEDWASEARVVSEFVRFDLDPNRLAPYPGVVDVRQMNVIRALGAPNDMWMDVAHKVRKNVKRARASGLEVVRDASSDRLEEFFHLYSATMARRSAETRYRFSLEWFQRLVSGLSGQFMLFYALKGLNIVATELVLVSSDLIYSYLGGTDLSNLSDRPNDLLKYEIALWAGEEGKRGYVLGGGYEPDDGIFRYKRSFAPNGVVPFSVGMRVFDRPRYEAMCRHASRTFRAGDTDRSHYFPEYRA